MDAAVGSAVDPEFNPELEVAVGLFRDEKPRPLVASTTPSASFHFAVPTVLKLFRFLPSNNVTKPGGRDLCGHRQETQGADQNAENKRASHAASLPPTRVNRAVAGD
jgi:hypothetical protein